MRAFGALALATGVAAQWSQECGGSWRHNSVAYNRTKGPPGVRHAAVFEAYLGDTDQVGHVHAASATPVISHNGLVIITDGFCRVYAYELPETLPQPSAPVRQTWQPVWTYTGSQSVLTAPDPECTTAVITPGNHIVWLSRQKHALFGINVNGVHRLAPTPLAWSPLQLPVEHFKPGTFTHRTSLLMVNHTVWVPSHMHSPPGALYMDPRNGQWGWAAGTPTSLNAAAAGSVAGYQHGNVNEDGKSAMFILNNATKSVEYFRSDGTQAWASEVSWSSAQRPDHPTFVDLPGNRHCVLLIRGVASQRGNMHAAAIAQVNGRPCWDWGNRGQYISNKYVANLQWVSSAAVLRQVSDNPDPIIYLTARLPGNKASLTSWIMTDGGLVLRDGHLYDGAPYAAPILLRAARGTRGHVVVFPGPGGSVQTFDAWTLAEGAYSTTHLRRWGDRDGLRILGPYMAASPGGTVFLMARRPTAPGSRFKYSLYMYAVTNVQYALPPEPSPAPSAGNGSNGAAVAGAMAGVAAVAGLAFFAWGHKTGFGGHGSLSAFASYNGGGLVADAAYKIPGVKWAAGAISGAAGGAYRAVTGGRGASSSLASSMDRGGVSFTSSDSVGLGGDSAADAGDVASSGFQARGGYGAIG